MVKSRRRATQPKTTHKDSISENSFEEKIDIAKHIYPPIFVDKSLLQCQPCSHAPVFNKEVHDTDQDNHHGSQCRPQAENSCPETHVQNDNNYFIDQPIYPPIFVNTDIYTNERDNGADVAVSSCDSDSDRNKQVFVFPTDPVINKPHTPPCHAISLPQYDCHKPEIPTLRQDNFVFGLLNIRKMDLILSHGCDLALQIDFADFMYPITIVDQNEKTNKDIPFLYSVESFLFQLQKRKNSVIISQFFIDSCCYNFVFRVLNICYIANYQVTIFVRTISNLKELEKIIYKNRCSPKVTAHCVVCSFFVDEGKISFPKDPCKFAKKTNLS